MPHVTCEKDERGTIPFVEVDGKQYIYSGEEAAEALSEFEVEYHRHLMQNQVLPAIFAFVRLLQQTLH